MGLHVYSSEFVCKRNAFSKIELVTFHDMWESLYVRINCRTVCLIWVAVTGLIEIGHWLIL